MKSTLLSCLFLCASLHCHADELIFVVPAGSAMPQADYQREELVGGMLKDIGDALAKELHRTPHYLVRPRKRLEEAISSSAGDITCIVRPDWVAGKKWQWTDTILTHQGVIASRAETPLPTTLAGFADRPLGTLLGYRYPDVEAVLGSRLVRDDANNAEANLAKLLAHRFDYMLTNREYLDYQRKVNPLGARLNPRAFNLAAFNSYCALSPNSRVDLKEVNHAIATLKKRGAIEAILDHYRAVK